MTLYSAAMDRTARTRLHALVLAALLLVGGGVMPAVDVLLFHLGSQRGSVQPAGSEPAAHSGSDEAAHTAQCALAAMPRVSRPVLAFAAHLRISAPIVAPDPALPATAPRQLGPNRTAQPRAPPAAVA
jgi:hypothetical protein